MKTHVFHRWISAISPPTIAAPITGRNHPSATRVAVMAALAAVLLEPLPAFDSTLHPSPNPPDGSAAYPWKIDLPADFDAIGNDGTHMSYQHYRIMKDLDCGNQDHRIRANFTATLDGGYHTISKIRVDQPSESHDGLVKTTLPNRMNIIRRDSFSIPHGEVVRFTQPGTASELLIMVTGDTPTRIDGRLISNGRVAIFNPKGAIIGSDGEVDARGGFLATSRHLPGNPIFAKLPPGFDGMPDASVANAGRIVARDGEVFLIGGTVSNSGRIRGENIALAAGSSVMFKKAGDGHSVEVSASDKSGKVTNTGSIKVVQQRLRHSGGKPSALAMKEDRSGEAAPESSFHGQAVITSGGGATHVGGSVKAGSALHGGRIDVAGGKVEVNSSAEIDASGRHGGGTIRIGGGLQGGDSDIVNAQLTRIAAGASISADARITGQGGSIILWADGPTVYQGHISATGGKKSGDGGFAEVSGKGWLGFEGTVDLSSSCGSDGTLLLDPTNLVINNGVDENVTGSSPFAPDGSPSVLTWATIKAALGSAAVTVTTNGSPNTAGHTGTITVTQPSGDLTSGNNLTITAVGTLGINAAIQNTGSGNITFNAPSIILDANVSTLGSQNYSGPVTLWANTVLSGSAVTFGSTLGGTFGLAVNTPGATTFGGAIGGTSPLASLTTNAGGTTVINGGTVVTTGNQTYNDAVTLGADTVLFGSAVTFGLSITGASNDLRIHAPVTLLGNTLNGGAASGVGLFTAGGNANVQGSTTFAGSYNFINPVTLGGHWTLTGSSVTFGSSVAGAFGLTAISGGITTFGGAVNITSLLTNAGGGTVINTTNVTTSGTQTYNDAVTLGANATLTGATLTLGAGLNAGTRNLTIDFSTPFTLPGGIANVANFTAQKAVNLGGAFTTGGSQTYNSAVTLGANAVVASSGNSAISFNSTVNGAFGLTVNTTGATTFGGAVGDATPLASLTTDAGGSTRIAGEVATSGKQTFLDAVTLTGNGEFIGTELRADSGIAGAGNDLRLDMTTPFTLPGGIAGVQNFVSEKAMQSNGVFTTTGSQRYKGAVALLGTSTFASTGAGSISFESGLDGGHGLTVNTAGATTFGGAVGATTPLASLTTNAGGQTRIDGGAVTTLGLQFYNDEVVLGNATTLDADLVIVAPAASIGGSTLHIARARLYVDGSSIGDFTALKLANGAVVEVTGTERVEALFIDGVQMSAGTHGSNISMAQFKDNTRFRGTGMVLVTSDPAPVAYSDWASIHAPSGGREDDFDGDGVPNAVEYILGGTRNSNDLGKLPVATTPGETFVVTFARDKASKSGDAAVTLQVGENLSAWPLWFNVGDDTARSSSGVTVTHNANGTETVTLILTRAPHNSRFARLAVLPAAPDMVSIPAGPFTMGADPDGGSTVTATISAFYLAAHEVTFSQWQAVYLWAKDNGYTDLPAGSGKGPDHPVHSIDWYGGVKWCNARSEMENLNPCYSASGATYRTGTNNSVACDWNANGYRLPTEAEWEKASRGGLHAQRFPWGNTISQNLANYYGSTWLSYDLGPNGHNPLGNDGTMPFTTKVGTFASNGYGLSDMAGNVWEWCWDWYGALAGGIDPRGPASGSLRMLRGGSWDYDARNSRCARRVDYPPGFSDYDFGFRVARSSVP